MHLSVIKKNLWYTLGKTNQTYFDQLTVFFYCGCFREFKNAILLVNFEMFKKTCAYMGGIRKLPATKIQLLALILLGLWCPLMSLIMLLAITRYSTVKEGSHLYIFSVLALLSGAIAVVCGYRNNSWWNYCLVVFRAGAPYMLYISDWALSFCFCGVLENLTLTMKSTNWPNKETLSSHT